MTQQIRTKWHKILSLIEAGEVYLTSAAIQGQSAQHWSDFGPNSTLAKQFVARLAELPKFVIADQLLPLTGQENFQQSLLDMKDAGVLHLPYPAMIVEFKIKKTGDHAIVLLRDNRARGQFSWEPDTMNTEDLNAEDLRNQDFYGIVFRVANDDDGEYLVLAPGIVGMSIQRNAGAPWLRIHADYHNYFDVLT